MGAFGLKEAPGKWPTRGKEMTPEAMTVMMK